MRTTRRKLASGIDRSKLLAALRRLGDEYVFRLLHDALDLLPPEKLATLLNGYFKIEALRPDGGDDRGLLFEVKQFAAASMQGDYYESFDVNSKNYTTLSKGTRAWMVECERLFGSCVAQAKRMPPAQMRDALGTLLELLRRIDQGNDGIVFFADEGGSWRVWVRWDAVLRVWFSCLSETSGPEEYGRLVVEVVDAFAGHDRDKHLAVARRMGTPAQRQALAGV